MYREITRDFGENFKAGDIRDYPRDVWAKIEADARANPKLGKKFNLADYTRPVDPGVAMERLRVGATAMAAPRA